MADVRSLLRQQRAARRIVHPHAAYSDAGKLLCTVCHEQVKAESLWEGHVRNPAHLQRVQKLQQQQQAPRPAEADQSSASNNKRRHDDDEDMDDVAGADEERDGLRRKRSRHDVQDEDEETNQDAEAVEKGASQGSASATENATPTRTTKPATPPLPRRTSGTPSQGVEVQLPSRPATPVATRTEFAGAVNGSAAASNRSPLRQSSTLAGFVAASDGGLATISTSSISAPASQLTLSTTTPADKTTQDVDEDEWAAFEADLLQNNNTNGTATSRPGIPAAPEDAVISAPVMTADQIAAKSAEEERERRRLAADVELDNEKEDATRALEEEFEEMEELEARVRRLKERREALRRQSRGTPPVVSEDKAGGGGGGTDGKANAADEESDEDDEDEDEDEDDWAGFRFKG